LFCGYISCIRAIDGWSDIHLSWTENKYLFNITEDPYEDTNVYDNSSYSSALKTLSDRLMYWSELTIDSNTPDSTDQMDTWDTCGHVCPWLNSTDVAITIDQIYDYDDAPHIVFVLVDDWGYNDFGQRSTYMDFVTPTLDSLADNGILLETYYTNEMCGPSRASLMTGRYSLRLGVHGSSDELPFTEVTLAQELKSAGYRTYIVGKWHLGQSRTELFPTNRGFDYFYGYVIGYESYWTKSISGYVDLFENYTSVNDSSILDSTYHSAYLFESKAEEVIKSHSENYADTPMFLYYPMHLVHYPWTAPAIYLERCIALSGGDDDYYDTDDDKANGDSDLISIYNYCGMNLMMDEAIANLTCTLETYGFSDNTILIISGDNGGEPTIEGSSYPYKGHKATAMRGAFANTAIIHSKIIPEDRRGGTYSYDVHITDWLPTLMGLATDNAWTGGYTGNDIDGIDIWDHLIANVPSGRNEIVFVSNDDPMFIGQYDGVKYIHFANTSTLLTPLVTFTEDLDSSLSRMKCSDPSLVDDTYSTEKSGYFKTINELGPDSVIGSSRFDIFVLFAMVSLFSLMIVSIMVVYYRNVAVRNERFPVDKTDFMIRIESEHLLK